MFIYIHGFASSANSLKARLLKDHFGDSVLTLDLSCEPKQAILQLKEMIHEYRDQPLMLLGSSLGGYYALHCSQIYNLPAVLINPSLQPFKTLERFANTWVKNYSKDETCFFKKAYIQQLKGIDIAQADQSNIVLLLQKGDTSLDYKVAQSLLPHAQQYIQEGGSHAYEGFEEDFGLIASFFDRFYRKA